MERMFEYSVGNDRASLMERLGNGDENGYEERLAMMIVDAVDFEESYMSELREENAMYYDGLLPGLVSSDEDEEDQNVNRSRFVSTDVRDTVLSMLPSLIRIFASTENVAEFVPYNEEGQDAADEQYDVANHVFYKDNNGYMILHTAFKDALTVKYGAVGWRTDNDVEIEEKSFSHITMESYQLIIYERPDVEVIGLSANDDGTVDATFRYEKSKPMIKVYSIPPENLRINKTATDPETAKLVGQECKKSPSEIMAMGYGIDEEELYTMATKTSTEYSDERYIRNPALDSSAYLDEGISYGEWFVRIDGDGDGIDELRRIVTIGDDRHIVSDEIVTHPNIAIFRTDPRPHTVISDCPADLTKDVQRMKSNMMRGQMDNLAESLNPRTIINELLVNVADAMNDEVGAIIRTKGSVSDSVHYTRVPYTGKDVQETVNYLDQVRASRTGVTEASKGLDPAAMQSTAQVGINAIISGAQERIELCARNLAETGLRPMLCGIVREIAANPNHSRNLKIRGKWIQTQPSTYDPSLSMEINPMLGKGTDSIRLQALMSIKQDQALILEKFGLKNPVVTPNNYLNTIRDSLELVNIKNSTRYFSEITPEIEAQIMSAPDKPDPASLIAQAELEKVKKDMVIAIEKAQQEQQRFFFEMRQSMEEADFKRDKLNVDTITKIVIEYMKEQAAGAEAQAEAVTQENKSESTG